MSDCQFTYLMQAYHDGQLDARRADEAEAHAASCAACAEELERLRELSRLLGSARPESIRPDELGRLHDVITTYTSEERDDRRILRLGVGLSAVAASILIISTAWLYDGPAGNPARPVSTTPPSQQVVTGGQTWENVAVGGNAGPAEARPTGTAFNDAADWMIGGMKGAGTNGNP